MLPSNSGVWIFKRSTIYSHWARPLENEQMDDLKNRSFSFDGRRRSFSSDNNKFTRSDNSHLKSELGSSLSFRLTSYVKLSDSMRLYDDVAESSNNYGCRKRTGAWAFVAKIFCLKKAAGAGSDSSDRRRSSSWRPDPNRRWPVQGWWWPESIWRPTSTSESVGCRLQTILILVEFI